MRDYNFSKLLFANSIKHQRLQLNLTVKEMADILGIPTQTLNLVEQGDFSLIDASSHFYKTLKIFDILE